MLKPSEIQQKEFKKTAKGCDEKEVDSFLEEVFIDYDKLYRENVELKDRLGALNKNMEYYRNMERTIQNTLVLAEKTAEDLKEAAVLRAKELEKEALLRGEGILQEAKSRISELNREISNLEGHYELMRTRIWLLLNAELELLEKNNPLNRESNDEQ